MIYPKFPEQGSSLGICAPSAGVGHKIKLFDKSLAALKSAGFDIIETASVRNDNIRSADAKTRGKEFNFLVNNPDVEMIVSAAGGDYNIEMLPYLDIETLANYPKWIAGASDPTNIMYYVTTKLDIATMYGFNAGSFDWDTLHEFQNNSFELMRGNTIKQYSFDKYDSNTDLSISDIILEGDVNWQLSLPGIDEIIDRSSPSESPKLIAEGRLIGGCIDCIAKLIGTPYDGTRFFVKKYPRKIWFLDNFAMTSFDLYLTMMQMKYCGYFRGTKAIVFGRTMFPDKSDEEYIAQLRQAIPDIPFIWNADIGHVKPCFTVINGAYGRVTCAQGKGTLEQALV